MNYTPIYINFLGKFFELRRPLKAIFDCSNGVAGLVLKKIVSKTPLIHNSKFIILNAKPDGNFPAHGPNPMYDEALSDLRKAIKKYKADFGVIFDGDGDRVFFVDDRGRRLSPDMSALLISKNFEGPILLSSTMGLVIRRRLRKDSKKFMDWKVGHYFMKRKMAKETIDFGAEHSGHFYFGAKTRRNKFYFDSGILSAIYFMNSVSKIDSKLSKWIDNLPKIYRSGEINFKVGDKPKAMKKAENFFKKRAKKISHLDGLRMEFAQGLPAEARRAKAWWFSLRPSNTEDVIRLNLEAEDKKIFQNKLSKIKNLILGR